MQSEKNSNKRLGAIVLMAVLAIAVVSTTTIAFSQGGESEEEEETTEVSIEVEGNEVEVEVKVEGGFEDGEYNIVLDCQTKPKGVEGPVVSGTLIVEDGEGEVKLEAELAAGKYADCAVTFGEFSQQVAGFTITAGEVEAQELETEEEAEEEIEVEATIVGTSSLAKVKVEFTSSSTDKESLLEEILAKIKLDEATVSSALEIETEEEELKEKLEIKVKIEDGKAEVEFEYEFVVESTERDAIISAIVDELQKLELSEEDIKVKIKHRVEEGESRARAFGKIAEKAKESAKVKGKPEVVENIGHAERYFGKADKAVVALKIGLESDDIESISFGSAQLILIKFGEQEPKFRAVINILTDTEFDTLTACLDGESIGELEIIPTSEELGLYIGHLRETLTGVSISIPGVTAYVVEGANCSATPILSGSI